MVGSGCELLCLVVPQEQEIPSLSTCACSLKGRQFADYVLEDDILDGPEETTNSSRQLFREDDTQPSISSDSDSGAPTALLTSDIDHGASQVNPHYVVPRYRCGTCGFPDCTCVMDLNKLPLFHLDFRNPRMIQNLTLLFTMVNFLSVAWPSVRIRRIPDYNENEIFPVKGILDFG